MRIRIEREGFEDEAREYNIKGEAIVLVAAEALERYRKDNLHATHVRSDDQQATRRARWAQADGTE